MRHTHIVARGPRMLTMRGGNAAAVITPSVLRTRVPGTPARVSPVRSMLRSARLAGAVVLFVQFQIKT